jgi:hypothetical protein
MNENIDPAGKLEGMLGLVAGVVLGRYTRKIALLTETDDTTKAAAGIPVKCGECGKMINQGDKWYQGMYGVYCEECAE